MQEISERGNQGWDHMSSQPRRVSRRQTFDLLMKAAVSLGNSENEFAFATFSSPWSQSHISITSLFSSTFLLLHILPRVSCWFPHLTVRGRKRNDFRRGEMKYVHIDNDTFKSWQGEHGLLCQLLEVSELGFSLDWPREALKHAYFFSTLHCLLRVASQWLWDCTEVQAFRVFRLGVFQPCY